LVGETNHLRDINWQHQLAASTLRHDLRTIASALGVTL